MQKFKKYLAIVIGGSAGGLNALSELLPNIPPDYPLPLILVQHRSRDHKSLLEEVLQQKCKLIVKQADEKEPIQNGFIYVAPPDYHLMIERDTTFSLSSEEPVKHSRPSIDVLFETAAEVFKEKLVGIILTGANSDGASGIQFISDCGGLTIAQDPKEAEYPFMPTASIQTGSVKLVLTLNEIHQFLIQLGYNGKTQDT